MDPSDAPSTPAPSPSSASPAGDGPWRKTACILCENNCGIEVQTEERRITRIRGDKDHGASAGYTCNKALRLDHYQNGVTRLTTPLRRETDGTFRPIDWDTAIAEIAARLAALRDDHGGDSILFYGGGGQGNHLGGAHSTALLRALGSRLRSNALAQEKTGEGWVDAHVVGTHTRGDFEHAELSLFIGKNPWQSHGVPRARAVLKEIARDPGRTMIVIDPVRTETAELADLHLAVRPGTDLWCLAGLLGTLVQGDLVDRAFLEEHVVGAEPVLAALAEVDVADCAARCGVPEAVLRDAAERIARAKSVATYEDLGVQQGPHSTLNSYLHKLLWILTGNFGREGTVLPHSWMAPLARYETEAKRSPATGTPMLGGLLPCNRIADEILADSDQRIRGMIVESANPAHSLAGSARLGQALAALELLVVIDVVMTETARAAHYILPAASQYEKWETTFFNFEFPKNHFQLRAPLFSPLPGTLPEAEIYARLLRALDALPKVEVAALSMAARVGRRAYAVAFGIVAAVDRGAIGLASGLLYESLGPTLPDGARSAAVLWGLAQRVARLYPEAMVRAGHPSADALFDAMLRERSGLVFTEDEMADAWRYVTRPGGKLHAHIPELLGLLKEIRSVDPRHTTEDFPFVLSAGQRREWSANTIFRDPTWRRRDPGGALWMAAEDADRLGISSGGRVRITTRIGSAVASVEINDRMQAGHLALPNGFGLDVDGRDGGSTRTGVAPNELTDDRWRDPIAGTPWHKHVPARVERVEG